MNWKNLLGIIFLCLAGSVFAQKDSPPPSCYFDELLQRRSADPAFTQRLGQMRLQVRDYLRDKAATPVLKNGSASLVIPVVVYIVHNNGPENISDNTVLSQLNVLNSYFDPYGIQFCLATMNGTTALPGTTTPGIMRIQNAALTDLDANTEHGTLAATSTLASSRYLRIWVVSNINGGTASGFSILPDVAPPALDGIVMDYNAFGDIATCGCTTLSPSTQNGRILVHEVGHYLGLYHTFNDACAGMNSATCDEEGDEVCDTPPVASPNSGCSAINSCPESPDLPDDIHNYMDYTSESCLTQFSNGQRDRMHAMIALYRGQLVSSANHVHTGINCNGGLLAGFTADNFAPCIGTTVNFMASLVPGATYTWDFGDGTTASGQSASHSYTAALNPGSVVLTVTLGGNSVSAIQTIFVEPCAPIQNSEAHWYFYNKNALDFGTGAPLYDNSAFVNNTFQDGDMGTNAGACEGSAAQSDANGNLLFYTNGRRIWNNNHVQITGGMHGHYSALNGVMIVPDPSNNGQYYVFTSDVRSAGGQRGFKYTKVQVTGTTATMVPGQLNIPITVPGGMGFQTAATTNAIITGEGITSVRHSNGYWIIAATLVNNIDQRLLIFNLTASGLSYVSNTAIGNIPFVSTPTTVYAINLQASPDGKRIAVSPIYTGIQGSVFDFDRCSGTLSNPRLLPTFYYGMEFSPNSQLLYGASTNGTLTQMNLEPCTIGSRVVGTVAPGSLTGIQRGPDQKLYSVLFQADHLVAVHRPNNVCTASNPNACQYDANGPAMQNGSFVQFCLPNMIDANTLPAYTNAVTATVDRCSPQCNTLRFDADLCATSYSWNFGDPSSGGNNTSTLAHPSHTFTSNGTYTVTVNGISTIVTVGVSPAITGSLTICPQTGMSGNYNAVIPAGYTVLWTASGGTVSGLANQSSAIVNWSSLPGSITLTLTDNVTGCVSTRTITVTQYCPPAGCVCDIDPSFTYAWDPSICDYHFYSSPGGSGCLQNLTYAWQFGDGTNDVGQTTGHIYTNSGTYEVCLTVSAFINGSLCQVKICKFIEVTCGSSCNCNDLKPEFTFSEDNCVFHFKGDNGAPDCNPNTEYYWDFGDGNSTTGQFPSHSYTSPGVYLVCMKAVIYDVNGNELCSEVYCKEIVVECMPPLCDCKDLKPEFTYNVDPKDCIFHFEGISGAPACDPNIVYYWNFGDGTTAVGQLPSHVFPSTGGYLVCLKTVLYDANGNELCSEEYCKEVAVECTPKPCDCKDLKPEFTYTFDPKDCILHFNGQSGAPACDLNIAYDWDFGDGNTSIGPNVGHAYAAAGNYLVCLKVTILDADGKPVCSEQYCKEVTAKCAGKCDCKLEPFFEIVGGGNCNLIFGATSGSDCVDIIAYDWYVNGSYVNSGQLFNYQFGVNTSYHVCVVVKGHTPDGDCDAEYCADFFFTDCYPIWPLPKAGITTEPTIGLFPNPAGTNVTVSYTADENEDVTILLRSTDGRLLNVTRPVSQTGAQQVTLDIPDAVANGFVFVEIVIGSRRYTEKLMILKD